MSNNVAEPQVSIVATPDTEGVHWNTRSGDALVVELQLPAWVLPPLVVPVTEPPAAGMIVARLHAFAKVAV